MMSCYRPNPLPPTHQPPLKSCVKFMGVRTWIALGRVGGGLWRGGGGWSGLGGVVLRVYVVTDIITMESATYFHSVGCVNVHNVWDRVAGQAERTAHSKKAREKKNRHVNK